MVLDPTTGEMVEAPQYGGTLAPTSDYLRGLCVTFLTGISKFWKFNLSSQLNNLTDITLAPVFSSICGYSEDDLDSVFGPELGGLDREQAREWYNGYSWRGAERIYNPFDVLLLLRQLVEDAAPGYEITAYHMT